MKNRIETNPLQGVGSWPCWEMGPGRVREWSRRKCMHVRQVLHRTTFWVAQVFLSYGYARC